MPRTVLRVMAATAVLAACGTDPQPLVDAITELPLPAEWEQQSVETQPEESGGNCSPLAGSDCPGATVTFATDEAPEAARDTVLAALDQRGLDGSPVGYDQCRGAVAGELRCEARGDDDEFTWFVVTRTRDDGEGSTVEIRTTTPG